MESLTPNIFVKDIDVSVAFYQALGFSTVMTVPEQPPFVWAMLHCGKIDFMLQTVGSLGNELPELDRSQRGGALLFYIKTSGIRSFFESLEGKVPVIKGLEKTFYGSTEFTIQDPDGFLLTFAEDE
jgi:catechol 2,3-dioxygenase-like lactoylglutathione lyase family enzyme